MSFLNNDKPIGYGAIMYSGTSTYIIYSYPFFTSQPNISALPGVDIIGNGTTISVADTDNYWLVMPGYKLELYSNTLYNALFTTYNNTTGITPVNYTPTTANTVSSFKLYYKDSQV